MTTAIGSYATLAGLKLRLYNDSVTATSNDTALSSICDQVNAYIEGPEACGRVIAPVSSAVYLFDGDNSRVLRYDKGIRAVSLLEVAQMTGGAYQTVPAADYRVRPSVQNRSPGWPANRIEFVDILTGSMGYFPYGYDTVRVTMTTGWDAIPDDITDVALTAATRAWASVQAGQSDIVGSDDMGRPMISRFFSSRDMGTLRAYSVNLP